MKLFSLQTTHFKQSNSISISKTSGLFILPLIVLFAILISSCSSSTRYTKSNETPTNLNRQTSSIRVLLDEREASTYLTLQSAVYLYDDEKKLAFVNPGHTIESYTAIDKIILRIDGKEFKAYKFFLKSVKDSYISFNDKSYNGSIQLTVSDNSINIVNYIDLEDYLNGVISKEMPLGVGTENLEALKALAICARTYAVLRMLEGKSLYDIFDDTRDQMYGGIDAESPLSDRAVEETKGILLEYDHNPALVFYSSTCGGHTAAVQDVFTNEEYPYLLGIKDGNEPYCKISSKFEWEESYSFEDVVDRLVDAALIKSSKYNFLEIDVNSRFNCGRVNELEIILEDEDGEEISVKIFGNDIRDVLRTGNGKSGLWSNSFHIKLSEDRIVLHGNGYGHGVGLCQWGAIYLSKTGWSYQDILQHYFPGTTVGSMDD